LAAKGQVNCHCCNGEAKYFAKFQNKNRVVRRFRCQRCGKTFSEKQPLDGLRVETGKIEQVVQLLCEGVGIRAASRLSGISQPTVLNILETVGEQCARFHNATVRNVKTENVETDELYSYVFCKQERNKTGDAERGEQYTFLSFCRDSKLIISYNTGKRTRESAIEHLGDLKNRVSSRFQLTTDNFKGYRHNGGAVCTTFGRDGVDYGMLSKRYAKSLLPDNRYSPPVCLLALRVPVLGNPDKDLICTSHVERQNLNVRIFNRRFTRLTLGYSKKLENLRYSVALFVCYWNFCWKHHTTKQSPAQVCGLTENLWSVKELLQRVAQTNCA
jgi:transposase-like protein/IS1 family transposase